MTFKLRGVFPEVMAVRMKQSRFVTISLLVMALASGAACSAATKPESKSAGKVDARTDRPAEPTKPVEVAKPANAPRPVEPARLNALAEAASKAGVKNCVDHINKVGNFLTADAQAGAHIFVSGKDPNQHLFSGSLEVVSQSASSYASTSFAASGPSGCDAMYEAVSYWNSGCDEVARKVFSAFKPTAPLKKSIQGLAAGENVRVYLMPAGAGCVSIKKEILY